MYLLVGRDYKSRSEFDGRSPPNICVKIPARCAFGRWTSPASIASSASTNGASFFGTSRRRHFCTAHCGFRKHVVAAVSFRGREGSALGAFDEVGGHRLRRFTGGYGAGSSPVYSGGGVLLDSVYRLKGRRVPCVILTEIDFVRRSDPHPRPVSQGRGDRESHREAQDLRGATRATMKLFLVMSEGAAGVMLDRLGPR